MTFSSYFTDTEFLMHEFGNKYIYVWYIDSSILYAACVWHIHDDTTCRDVALLHMHSTYLFIFSIKSNRAVSN